MFAGVPADVWKFTQGQNRRETEGARGGRKDRARCWRFSRRLLETCFRVGAELGDETKPGLYCCWFVCGLRPSVGFPLRSLPSKGPSWPGAAPDLISALGLGFLGTTGFTLQVSDHTEEKVITAGLPAEAQFCSRIFLRNDLPVLNQTFLGLITLSFPRQPS